MIRNRLAMGLVGIAMLWLCSPVATAQTKEKTQQPETQWAQVEKSVAATGAATWEVRLNVQGGGTQPIAQPVDIVLLLDSSESMTAQRNTVVPQAAQKTGTLPQQVAQTMRSTARTKPPQAGRKDSVHALRHHVGALSAMAQSADSIDTAQESLQQKAAPAQAFAPGVQTFAQQPAAALHTALGLAPVLTPTQRNTRIGVAKSAAQEFLTALQQTGIPARVGVIAYAGTANTLLPLTPMGASAQQDDTNAAAASSKATAQQSTAPALTHASDAAAITNAVTNLWQAAYGPDDLCFGNGRGTNLERAFVAANAMLKRSSAAAKYVVVLGGAQPSAIGEAEQSCLVPEADPAYASEQQVAAATRTALHALAQSGVSRVYTVGIDTKALSAYATQGAAYSVQGEATAPLREIAALLGQRVQSPAVTDNAGAGLVIEQGSAVCTPTTLGAGAQPYVTVAPDGASLYWSLGAWLPEGQTATLSYTLKVADLSYGTAGKDLPLGSATLVYNTPEETGALHSVGAAFDNVAVRYATGALRVYSSGLPAQLGGTSQNIGATPVTGTAHFQVQPPAQHSGWRIESVVHNGQVRTLAQFERETQYRLQVKEGISLVEYRYVPAPTPAEQWGYTVQYYRDGLLLTDNVMTGKVLATAPVIEAAPASPEALQGCAENPMRTWPHTLQKDGEVLRIDYLTQARNDAQVYVHHNYTDEAGAQIGAHTTAPAQDAASYQVHDLFAMGYGGNVYMPVLATITITAADGTRAQQQNIPIGGSFVCAQDERATLELQYVPLKPQQPAPPQPLPSASSIPPTAPAQSVLVP